MSCIAGVLAGCGGGGGGGGGTSGPIPIPTATPPPGATSATSSGTVGTTGGAVAVTLGTQTVTVTVPSGALSGSGTLSVTIYAPSAYPKTLQAGARKTRTIGAHPTTVAEFTVTVSGAAITRPLQASLTTPPAVSGSIFRLAGYGSSWDDVDTVTFAGSTATSDLNIAFPRMSLANATLYGFYIEPSAEAAPAAPVITPATTSALPVGIFGSAVYTATEALANGFPYLDTAFSYALDNPTLGSINAATGAFSAGGIDAGGNVVATDTTAGRGSPTGKSVLTVSSQRPGNTTDAFSFTGSLSSTTQLTASRAPTQPQVDAATVTLSSTVAGFTQNGTGGTATVSSAEADTYPLQTITTNATTSYVYTQVTPIVPSAPKVTLSIASSDATDSNGARFKNQYGAGNGVVDVLPESSGTFGPNNAALTYDEIDPALFTRHRVVAAGGSYVEQGTDAFNDVQTITARADLSAFVDANQYSGLNFDITKPNGSGQIVITVKTSAGASRGTLTIPSWIPAGTAQPSTETDVNNGSKPFPAGCNVPAKYGTSGNQIVQTINRIDAALGNLETQTTTTWVGAGVGPVCIQLTDAVQTFYDYTLQNGSILFVSGNAQPIQLTTIAETLTLQSATTSNGKITQSMTRGAAAIHPSAFAPVAFARARFDHAVRERLGGTRRATFNRGFMSRGVQAL
jgi:hypothetical protein